MAEEYTSFLLHLSRRMVKVEESVELTEQSYVEEWDGKHPLASSWSFWYFNRHLSKTWEDCLKKIGTFDTVEDFWCYSNYLQPPSFIKAGCDLCIFKEGISPMWEDVANKRGGRWDIHLDKQGFSLANLDDYWMKLTMDLIGGRFGELDEIINGAVVNRRDKANRISLWTSVSMQRDRLTVLGIHQRWYSPFICLWAARKCTATWMCLMALNVDAYSMSTFLCTSVQRRKQLRSFIGLPSDHKVIFRTNQDCTNNSTSQHITIRL